MKINKCWCGSEAYIDFKCFAGNNIMHTIYCKNKAHDISIGWHDWPEDAIELWNDYINAKNKENVLSKA